MKTLPLTGTPREAVMQQLKALHADDAKWKDGKTFSSEVSERLLSEPAEKSLFAALTKARTAITAACRYSTSSTSIERSSVPATARTSVQSPSRCSR